MAKALPEFLKDADLHAEIELGRARIPLADLDKMAPGTVVELDRRVGDPVKLIVNGTLVAMGEILVVDGCFAFRVTEILAPIPPKS